ncbi:WD40-like Beta Propeller Repeat [Micromonospora viridifaciens]|uniref:WD40-like Beta Propeller Repeat n=1 Tax=Micromonospora viridifaciens TaxID=1881 RepID=A0A1C4X425_MICVI|nr:VWA domain-containing protein [Micromonospora viridifaciens]SCF03185.1 WD40-like Beta Propeller Repeat [Micromonospora viridifaciens]
MRWGSRGWGIVVLGLLAGPVVGAPEPPAAPAPAAPSPTAETGYRLGYTSPERPTLTVSRAGKPQPLLSEAERGDAEQDADARAGRLVWVGRKAPTEDGADLGGALYLRRPGAGPLRLVGGPGTVAHPALSPDGRWVAFTSDRAGSADLWIVGVDGRGLRRLTDHPAEDTWPSWSPDGTRIAFGSTRADIAGDIWTVPAAGGAPVRVTDGPAAEGQPAWSPDGRRIAFTTTRFTSAGEPSTRTVAVVAAAGGPVARAVPGPGDAAEPAWSADGALAFTTTRDDPSGDVYVVRAGRVVPVATGPLPQHEPAWQGNDLLWTATEEDSTTDVWSADATGGDRRDHTARPGLSETGPAFSPDGSRLAYSAEQPDGGARIVIADATGANPQLLAPPGTVDGDRDTDPTWSPAGDAIAFTRQPSEGEAPSRILAVSVADARLLAEVPMPAYLTGSDAEPSWSPDGRQLAFTRDAVPRGSELGTPFVDRPALPGSTFTVEQTVPTPEIPPRPDIVFLVDDTRSMSLPGEGGTSVIGQLKARLREVIGNVRSTRPDAWFGLATFTGYSSEDGEYDENVYYPRQPLTGDDEAVQHAVDALTATDSHDVENWFYALWQLAANDRIGFRPDSSRVVVLISDTWSVDQSFPPPGDGTIEKDKLIRALRAAGIAVIGVPISGAEYEEGLNKDGVAGEIAEKTGGGLTADSGPAGMIDKIQQAIRELTITVHPSATCQHGLSVEFDPNPAEVKAGRRAVFQEIVSVAPGAVPGSVLRCTLRFDLDPPDAGKELVQELIVRVAQPGLPLVRVDDVQQEPTGPDGARVTYTASAVDAAGRPLPVRCQPPSGSLFPIGQTVVTCTATDRAGRTGSDTALIVVTDPEARGRRIWLARLDGDLSDLVTVTDQHDLSARVGEACPSRSDDQAPAWSPDGSAIAFSDSGDDLCVAAPDGSGARHPLVPGDRDGRAVTDPAWSPDGRRIAVALLDDGEGPGFPSAVPADIVVLPSAGGPATAVIRGVGRQPAFQRLPRPDLTLTVSAAGVPAYVGGGPITVTFTVRNATGLPADNVWLDVTTPAPLAPPASADPRCGAGRRLCLLGTLRPGARQVVTVVLPARAAVTAVVAGRLTATVRGVPAARTAQAPVRVLAPQIRVDPLIGPPGFVTAASGANFPPGARVRLRWAPGITTTPDTVTAGPDGSFRTQLLVLRKDTLGPRDLTAARVSGPAFGPVRAPEPFLVVPRELGPPVFAGRG